MTPMLPRSATSAEAGTGRLFTACLDAVCAELQRRESELCALDRAIGDGDHGANLARAAHALLDAKQELSALPLASALERAGVLVVMTVGGASGPLYGSFLMALGRSWPLQPTPHAISGALEEAVAAVGRRGRSTEGEKTMLDVLVPAARAFRESTSVGFNSLSSAMASMLAAADDGFEAARPLRATKGRAAYVGERSIGHLDPGAASARLCLHVVARVVSDQCQRQELAP